MTKWQPLVYRPFWAKGGEERYTTRTVSKVITDLDDQKIHTGYVDFMVSGLGYEQTRAVLEELADHIEKVLERVGANV